MLGKFKDKDFEAIRNSALSRQTPSNLAGAFIISIPLLWLMYFLVFYVAGDATGDVTNYPLFSEMMLICFWISIALTVFMVLFTIRVIYMKFQKIQYLVGIGLSHALFGGGTYLAALFIIGKSDKVSADVLIKITLISLSTMVIILLVTVIRFITLLNKGAYRRGTAKDVQRTKFEGYSYVPIVVIASTGFVITLQIIISNYDFEGLNQLIVIVIGFLVAHVMSFVLPEQLVILYCKYRFKSFNFDNRGKLYYIEDDH
ncbi:hypothetical protein [Rossellomorea marisflavi]|uniref:hypothetical protein n=1 Tax=Rossellomorea marisflavi TaxID=189381 RepID=UPI003459FB6B